MCISTLKTSHFALVLAGLSAFSGTAVAQTVTHPTKYYLDLQNDATQKAYGLLDASRDYPLLHNAQTVGPSGKNLTSKFHEAYGSAFLADVVTVPAPPRTCGIQAHYKI